MEEFKSSLPSFETASSLSAVALRELQQRAQAALAASREQAARLEADITRQLDDIAATLNEQTIVESQNASEAAQFQVEIARISEEFNSSRDAWLTERTGLESERDRLANQVKQLEAENRDISASLSEQSIVKSQTAFEAEQFQADIARLTEELNSSQSGWLAERADFEAQRDQMAMQVAQLEAQNRESQDEWREQLVDFEGRLLEQQNFWNEQRAEAIAARGELERERDELQQKFELALQDVQRFRSRVAELEQDLARRPEANLADSAELVGLRAERDALSGRVEELEQRPDRQVDQDVEQQMADLQRRFELAVEDVRELKTKNTKLESLLAAANTRSPGHVDIGGMDWESQKRRLLAALENSDDDPAEKQERLTIKGTIEITDAVVAEKDQQIAALTAQLEAIRENPATDGDSRSRKIDDLINADAVIAEHRMRWQLLERETEEKLRAAELEVSLERAKIARQKAEVEELRANLESERQLYEATGVVPAPGAPRRRWLSKFGISGDEKDS